MGPARCAAAQVGNCHGFVANRMMANYGVEARNVLMSGTIRSLLRLAPGLRSPLCGAI